MVYVLASELLHVESLPFASYLQKTTLYSLMPWFYSLKRRFDKAVMYLESAKASMRQVAKEETLRLLDKAAAQRCKSMMPEILDKRSAYHQER